MLQCPLMTQSGHERRDPRFCAEKRWLLSIPSCCLKMTLATLWKTAPFQPAQQTCRATQTAVDLDSYGRCAGHLRRLFETLGVERRPRDVSPTLADIVAEIAAAKTEPEEGAPG